MKTYNAFIIHFLLFIQAAYAPFAMAEDIIIASKNFTESVLLAEIANQITGPKTRHHKELGGTRILWSALLKGNIDIYPEYSGTLLFEILANAPAAQKKLPLAEQLAQYGIGVSRPIGFNNTYALGTTKTISNTLNITNISDLIHKPELRIGLSNEFLNRNDGWPGLKRAYQLPHTAKGMDHDLSYRALNEQHLDIIDLYSTDAEIAYYDITILNDDRQYFPEYQAVYLYRLDLAKEKADIIEQLLRLESNINTSEMSAMNAAAKLEKQNEAVVAQQFLTDKFQLTQQIHIETRWSRLLRHSIEHLSMVAISLSFAILIAIPLGILAYYQARLGHIILSLSSIIQTIPALALLVFLIPLFGIGGPPAIIALFLYSLLPIIRNTYIGLQTISKGIRESAQALGLSAYARLRLVELPLAMQSILAGIKTAAVINIGIATLGALIGAGGYGQPILTGIRLDDIGLILEGAIPAALLALLVQWLFDLSERLLVPKGLRLK